jgi:hypothetical protein
MGRTLIFQQADERLDQALPSSMQKICYLILALILATSARPFPVRKHDLAKWPNHLVFPQTAASGD